MPNDVKIKGSKPISENLSTITVGDQTTCLEISDSNGARVTGDLEVTGDIKGNVADVIFDDITFDDITCDKITIDNWVIDSDGIDSAGDIILDHTNNEAVIIKEDGSTYATLYSSDLSHFVLYNEPGGSSTFILSKGTNALITTSSGDLDIVPAGELNLDSYGYLGSGGYPEADSKNITLTPGASVVIDKNRSETGEDLNLKALIVDLDKTGASTDDNIITGLNIDVDNTTATNGTNTMYGFYCSPTLTHAADAGTTTIYGGQIVATGGTNGTSTAIGLDLQATGADTNVQLKLTANAADYATFHCADTGDLTIATIGDGTKDSDMLLDVDGKLTLNTTGKIYLKNSSISGSTYMTIDVGVSPKIATKVNVDFELESTGTGNLILDSGADIDISSNDGNFIMRKGATEFSATNSAYAGMILGYTRIQNDSTGASDAVITINTSSMTVLQTVDGTDLSIQFIVPPSGNVEIQCSFWMVGTSRGAKFSLSSDASYAELGINHTYDGDYTVYIDETDHDITNICFSVTGLVAGTDTTYYLAGLASGSSMSIFHGRFRATGTHYPPILLKAIALPATIVTGE